VSVAYCGGVLDARYNGTIYSPGYPSPGYRQDVQCSWLIKVTALPAANDDNCYTATLGH